jgi:hypothetical protein
MLGERKCSLRRVTLKKELSCPDVLPYLGMKQGFYAEFIRKGIVRVDYSASMTALKFTHLFSLVFHCFTTIAAPSPPILHGKTGAFFNNLCQCLTNSAQSMYVTRVSHNSLHSLFRAVSGKGPHQISSKLRSQPLLTHSLRSPVSGAMVVGPVVLRLWANGAHLLFDNLTEVALWLHMDSTHLFCRARVMGGFGTSVKKHPCPQDNDGFALCVMRWFLAPRALRRTLGLFPGDTKARPTKAVPTAQNDWVQK